MYYNSISVDGKFSIKLQQKHEHENESDREQPNGSWFSSFNETLCLSVGEKKKQFEINFQCCYRKKNKIK
jgi:hypothetical protein